MLLYVWGVEKNTECKNLLKKLENLFKKIYIMLRSKILKIKYLILLTKPPLLLLMLKYMRLKRNT